MARVDADLQTFRVLVVTVCFIASLPTSQSDLLLLWLVYDFRGAQDKTMVYPIVMSVAFMTIFNINMDVEPWRSINDGVMGGLSAGGMLQTDEGLKFSGKLSLENNGGFSSVRRLVSQDLSNATGIRIQVRGDGREYQFRIRQSSGFDGVSWSATFSSGAKWQTIDIALDQFTPVYRGRVVPQAGPVVPSEIQQIGFLVADKTAGRFELEIRSIEFIGPEDERIVYVDQ
jgi:monofunctional biosynthetic peptidoglycan transglycosylase